ncbi:MAG: aminotransferase class IV [Pseudomonadales bacterium]|jgi:branched-chain amino acid aminotransferase|nr:aminotransferase class IV [Pseudomonadales bacterium]MDP6472116.1 aminotransferase class IV [Pseudomonadales bacterium]MDP6826632.1 aminotransferase class IV [Pseudomonadales bacterium]MDP6970007.1 aminotransferase class IV [Pseudomonadales bacterium]|tara:strand:+ start:5340 stop:6284 length:945 start_codon:yes stop_codon:yes gene_type:complete
MAEAANQRVAYFNGQYLPEGEIRIPFRDRGFLYGDGAFDMTRTFGGEIFKLREHIERLYRSLKALRIDAGLAPEEMMEITREVVRRNTHFLSEATDYWVAQRISRGVAAVGDEGWDEDGATVIVECLPLPLKARASYYRDGVDVVLSPVRRTAPDVLTPRAKTLNYLNLISANMAASQPEPNSTDPDNRYTVLLDVNGNLAEGLGANLFLVMDGECLTPREQFVLPGVSRETTMDLAHEIDIPMIEKDLDLHDAYNADEIFLTSTSLCIVPVKSFCGAAVGSGAVPGPVTKRLSDAYVELVDFDFVAQYLRHLD